MTGKKPYHHENLRASLLEAAVALVGERGPRGFTLREVARRAGVSHNAPYRHFASRDELLKAVAEEGFERLREDMILAQKRGQTALDRLRLSGCGYVEFALRWPNHFTVLFDLPRQLPEESAKEPAEKGAFSVLLQAIRETQAEGVLPPGDALPLALTAWSLVHGIARLAVSGTLPMSHEQTLEFTWQATELLGGALHTSSKS
ncbi:TetR/AcrR family transcriptional regulator [Telmatobacter bradus]|uniref:TetR/AcrR family transcriptional regulator n=1 Tax=Telmatobacter bradus TaxID=474953 RepID=UPI003B43CBD5